MVYTRDGFVKRYTPAAQKAVKGTGILVGTLLAQAILESQGKMPDGSYRVGGSKLAREANNYFGIKCHGWSGKVYNIKTGEYTPAGQEYDVTACFRAYDSVDDSLKDYVKFLRGNPRYQRAGVFEAKTVQEQATALKKAGYATAPNYPSMVTGIYNKLKDTIKMSMTSPVSFAKKYWWAIALGTAGIVGLFYVGITLRRKK